MKKPFIKILFALLTIIAFSCEEPRFVVGTTFSTPIYSRPLSPGDGYIWIEGEWFWNGNGYSWRDGYWSFPSRSYRWSPGHWTPKRHGYYWRPGRWR